MAKTETMKTDESGLLADLVQRVAAQGDHTASLRALVEGLADRIKATSNDQNAQRLSRALRAAAPALVEAVAAHNPQPAH